MLMPPGKTEHETLGRAWDERTTQGTKLPRDQANTMRRLLSGRHGSLVPGFPGPLVAWFLGP